MIKTIKKYLSRVVIGAIILVIGFLLGTRSEDNQRNDALYETQNIAVVNLDEGLEYEGEYKNFAKEITEIYSENYVITGLEDAQSGLEDGRYAAYIILPSDFSFNVVSVNEAPQKSMLKYEISDKLSQESTDKAWQNVMMFKEDINDDIGYIYISSILGEFHIGQDSASKVLKNDTKDKDVLMAISNLDLVTMLDLREVERLQNDIKELDVTSHVENNKLIINSIDLAYKDYLSQSDSQLNSLKKESNTVNDDNQNVENASQNIKNLIKDDGTKNYNLNNSIGFLNQYNSNLTKNISDMMVDINSIETNNAASQKQYVTARKTDLDVLIQGLDQNHVNIETQQKNTIKQLINNEFFNTNNNILWDWNVDFPSVISVIDNQKDVEKYDNAENYIDKVILNQISSMDLSKITDFNTLVNQIQLATKGDKKLQEALQVYATYTGTNPSSFDLTSYINQNQNIYTSLPAIQNTSKTDALDASIKNAFQTNMNLFLNKQLNNIESNLVKDIDALTSTTIVDNAGILLVNNYKNDLETIPSVDFNILKAHTQNLQTVDGQTLESAIDLDLSTLAKEQMVNKRDLLSTVQNHSALNSIYHNNLLLFNPLDFIDENEVNNYVKSYDKNNSDMGQLIEHKNSEYLSFVTDSYSNADEQVFSMREDIQKYQEESDNLVINGLEEAKKSRVSTSKVNSELMGEFVKKLPYTRNGSIENNAAYDFIATPIEMEGQKISNYSLDENKDYSLILLGILVVGVGVYGGLKIVKGSKIEEED